MDEKEAGKKHLLRNEKIKANRASEAEGQRRERLRIRRKKIDQEREPKTTRGKERSSETEDHKKQRLATLKD